MKNSMKLNTTAGAQDLLPALVISQSANPKRLLAIKRLIVAGPLVFWLLCLASPQPSLNAASLGVTQVNDGGGSMRQAIPPADSSADPETRFKAAAGVQQARTPVSRPWRTRGNKLRAGEFLGTLNDEPLEFRVNGATAFRLESAQNSPNIIGGFSSNTVSGRVYGATISGGGGPFEFGRNELSLSGINHVSATFGTVGGGAGNAVDVSCDLATVAGGGGNVILSNSPSSVVGGGFVNLIQRDAASSTIGGGEINTIEANGSHSTIGGGVANSIQARSLESVIAGGAGNTIGTDAPDTTIGGGSNNGIEQRSAYSTISGGYFNKIAADASTSTVGGGNLNVINAGAFISTIGGGAQNTIGDRSTASTISGGNGNSVASNSTFAYIGGGVENAIRPNNYGSIIVGGNINRIEDGAQESVIGGGSANIVDIVASGSTIAGGLQNHVGSNAYQSVISGGIDNAVLDNAVRATIPGGSQNVAGAPYSFAAGRRAQALSAGSFVWGDSSDADVTASVPNQFVARASGGVSLYTDPNLTAGVQVSAGGGSWSSLSDRSAKENFGRVDARQVLDEVVKLPIQTWNMKTQPPSVRHIGPMAQDFSAAFGVGEDDKHIATVDADGVALAAIQGLHQKLTEELQRRDAENAELKRRLERLERILAGDRDAVAR